MYSMRYGTVPVVRATGGLGDTVENFDLETRKGNGFKFGPYSASAMLEKSVKRFTFIVNQIFGLAYSAKEWRWIIPGRRQLRDTFSFIERWPKQREIEF